MIILTTFLTIGFVGIFISLCWKPVYDEYRRLGYRLKDKKKE